MQGCYADAPWRLPASAAPQWHAQRGGRSCRMRTPEGAVLPIRPAASTRAAGHDRRSRRKLRTKRTAGRSAPRAAADIQRHTDATRPEISETIGPRCTDAPSCALMSPFRKKWGLVRAVIECRQRRTRPSSRRALEPRAAHQQEDHQRAAPSASAARSAAFCARRRAAFCGPVSRRARPLTMCQPAGSSSQSATWPV